MIQQKELRAGNIVLVPSIDDEYYEMAQINRYGRDCKVTDHKLGVLSGVLDIENIKPIPLDESILLSCPQFKSDYKDSYFFGNVCVEYLFGIWNLRIIISESESVFIKNVYYLHDLQNFVFALTQTELEINLKELTDKKD